MELTEGVGESPSPPRNLDGLNTYDIRDDVYHRFLEAGNEEAFTNPDFRVNIDSHFNRLPSSYALDVNMERVEDVLLHQKLLAAAEDPDKRPVYHIRFLENLCTEGDANDDQQYVTSLSARRPFDDGDGEELVPSQKRSKDHPVDFELFSKLEDLNLDVGKSSKCVEDPHLTEKDLKRKEIVHIPIHEVIFSTIDRPKLLSQLSALLSDIGLNIREAHVFSTTDGYSLDVFVVDGWPVEGSLLSLIVADFAMLCGQDTDGLYKAMEAAVARKGSSSTQETSGDWEIDRKLLELGEIIASGHSGDLYHGIYVGQDVAVKMLRCEDLTEAMEDEFTQEVTILREVQHKNVVRFIGACTESAHLCIVTEYMPGGSLYHYLRKNHNDLKLTQLLKFAIDVCKGMDYLHQNHIIHRDLKTANLLLGKDNVVKVADFGISRFQNQGGVMTAETGTYKWMAPEVMNHQPYDQKADVFSFAIVLWELLTAKVPYDNMTPLQAALKVRQGVRPDLPENAHPRLLDLMQRCWDEAPDNRPSFSGITVELEILFEEVKETA